MPMTKRIILLTLAFLLAPKLQFSQPPAVAAKERMVIVISLDGFPAYYLADPKLAAPTLRSLIAQGSWAKQMTPINPTWTWPNHTTMVTGLKPASHGLLYNGSLIRTDNPLSVKVDPAIPKTQMVRVPTVYDIAWQHGLTTAQVDWVAINDAPTITWAFPEKASTTDPLVKEMMSAKVIQASDVEGNAGIVWRDNIWTKAGEYLIRKHHPNLLLFHLLTGDSTQHTYGPKTLAAYDAVAFLDSCVRRLVDAVKEAGMYDRTTFLVVSDHGFRAVRKQIFVKDVVAAAHLDADLQVVPEGGSAMIYVAKNRRQELLQQMKTSFAATEGVERVVGEAEYAALGYPLPSQDSQMPDLIALAKPDYGFGAGSGHDESAVRAVAGTIGAHGYLNTDLEMQAIFIASGYGIKRGVELDHIANTAIAPTLAKLLGIELPKTLEPPLTQILK
jgi:predicted AlkP superfamily pyrophosphatase or phosphodiesterase